VVVVGASAGGVEALRTFTSNLPADLDAAVLVVLHLLPTGPSLLPEILDRECPLRVTGALDGMPVEPGTVIVARPDRHLCVSGGAVEVNAGPRVNGHRPAIDPLFSSAAQSFGGATTGVLLSGMLDDGVAGLRAIRAVGGTTAVQDPEEAIYPSMPRAAIGARVVDRVMGAADLGRFVAAPRPLERVDDAAPSAVPGTGSPQEAESVSELTCPNCGGSLWEREWERHLSFRCRTGHAYSGDSLLDVQAGALDDALWGAYRSLLEQAELNQRMADRVTGRAHERYRAAAHEAFRRAEVMHEALSGRSATADS
jgi:two-component system, chemotaxis family, protein-glutamate methylesterase/glutaminase